MIRRTEEYKALINSAQWRTLRAQVMEQSKGLCVDCRRAGRYVAANVVHHIVPVERFTGKAMKRAMFDPGNLVALCNRCHGVRHAALRSHDRRRINAEARNRLLLRLDELATPSDD